MRSACSALTGARQDDPPANLHLSLSPDLYLVATSALIYRPIGQAAMMEEVRLNFRSFMDARPAGQPSFFFFGPCNTHRTWERGSGKARRVLVCGACGWRGGVVRTHPCSLLAASPRCKPQRDPGSDSGAPNGREAMK